MMLLEPVARLAYRRRKPLLVLFVVLFAAAAVYGRGTAHELVGGGFDDPGSESARADAALKAAFGLGTPNLVVAYTHEKLTIDDLDMVRALGPALEKIRQIPGIKSVGDPFAEHPDALISTDKRTVVVPGSVRAQPATARAARAGSAQRRRRSIQFGIGLLALACGAVGIVLLFLRGSRA